MQNFDLAVPTDPQHKCVGSSTCTTAVPTLAPVNELDEAEDKGLTPPDTNKAAGDLPVAVATDVLTSGTGDVRLRSESRSESKTAEGGGRDKADGDGEREERLAERKRDVGW